MTARIERTTQSTPLAKSSMVRLPKTKKCLLTQENVLSGNAAAADRDQGVLGDARKLPAQGRPYRMGRRQPSRSSDRLLHRRPVVRRRWQSLHRRHSGERQRRSYPGPSARLWIASRNLSSGAHGRDPLARNDENTKTLEVSLRQQKFGRNGPHVSVIGQGTWHLDRGDRKSAVAAL